MLVTLSNFNYSFILEIYNLVCIFVLSFGLHYLIFILLLKCLAPSNLQLKLSYLINNYLFITVPVLFCIFIYLYLSNPIFLTNENDKVELTFAIADVKVSVQDASTILSYFFKSGSFLLGGSVAAVFLKGGKAALLPRLAMTAASGALMSTSYHAVHTAMNRLTQAKDVTMQMKVQVTTNGNLLDQGHVKNWVTEQLITEFSKLDLTSYSKENLTKVSNSISQVDPSSPLTATTSDLLGLNVTVLQGQEAMGKINSDYLNSSVDSPSVASEASEALDLTPSATALTPPKGGSWPASSPLEENLPDFPHREDIINILSLNLTLVSLMLYFTIMLFLIISAKLLLESGIEFNIIKKLPYGTNLHYYFLKYITLLKKVNSFWLYFVLCNLFFGNIIVIYCLYKIISIL